MEKQRTKKKTKIKKEITSKGVYENGNIKLSGKGLPKRKMNVVVTFKEDEKDEKQAISEKVDAFVKKWSGAIKVENIKFVTEKKLEYLIEKHK